MNASLNVTLRQLRVFIEVSRLRSFSRAGAEIGLTQSAVSRSVRELESEIGLKLIDRTTREVQLTDVGMDLVGTVSRLLADLDEALREARDLGQQRRGRVIVAASPTIACRLMPRVIASCSRQFPLVTLSLRDDVQSDVLRKVKSGEVDFGVVIGPFSADDLHGEAVMTDSFCLVARRDHPLAHERAAFGTRSRASGSSCWTTHRAAARLSMPSCSSTVSKRTWCRSSVIRRPSSDWWKRASA